MGILSSAGVYRGGGVFYLNLWRRVLGRDTGDPEGDRVAGFPRVPRLTAAGCVVFVYGTDEAVRSFRLAGNHGRRTDARAEKAGLRLYHRRRVAGSLQYLYR